METNANSLRGFIKQLSPVVGSYGKESVLSYISEKITEIEKTTSVLFCGEFKRGKSSLVNAIVGGNLCPTDVGIATSAVSIIRYGQTEKAYRYYGNLLEDADSLQKEEIAWDDIEKYVKGDALDIDNTILVELYYPSPFLKEGITVIDTPGIGGLDPRHAILTHMALPKADIIVFVTDAGEPITDSELKFFSEKIMPCGKYNLVLINKSDILLEKVLKTHIDDTRLQLSKMDVSDVLPVSAEHWMKYNRSEDDDYLASSNRNGVLAAILKLVEQQKRQRLMELRDMLVTEVTDVLSCVKMEMEQLNADAEICQNTMESLTRELEKLKTLIQDIKNPQSSINLQINSIFEDARNEVSNLISHEGGELASTEFESLLNSENGLDNDGKWFIAQINDRLRILSCKVDNEIKEAFQQISERIKCRISDLFVANGCQIQGEMEEFSIINSQLFFSLAGKVTTGGMIGGAAMILTNSLIPGIGIIAGLVTAGTLIWKQISRETQQQKRMMIRQKVLPKVNLAITDLRNQANVRFTKFHQNLLQTLQSMALDTEKNIKTIHDSLKENYGKGQACKDRIAGLEQCGRFLQTFVSQLNLLYSTPFAHAK